MSESLDAVRDRAVSLMRQTQELEGRARTEAVKSLAVTLVDARELIPDRDGNPDLLGRSRTYREFTTGALDAAEVPKAARTNLMTLVRHHLSTVLRDRHADDLAGQGVDLASVAERNRRRQARNADVQRLFTGGLPVDNPEDLAVIAEHAGIALRRIQGWPVDTTPEQRATILAALQQLRADLDAAVEGLA